VRHIHCKLLLAFAFLLFTLPAFGAETRGVKRVEIKTSVGETVGLYEESHALVIGVSDYTAGWPRLRGVREVRQALEGRAVSRRRKVDHRNRGLPVPQGAHPEKPHRLCHLGLGAPQGSGPPDRKHRLSDQARHALAVHDQAVENPISQHGSCASPNYPIFQQRHTSML